MCIVGFGICLIGNILRNTFTKDEEEVLADLLTKPEYMTLDTTREKGGYCPYQIQNGILYLNGQNGFCQYDFARKEWKTLWTGDVYDYLVVGDAVYCMEFADDSGTENMWNIISRNLNNLQEKKVLIENVFDCVFAKGYIYYSCFDENVTQRNIYQYDTNTLKSRELFSFDLQADEVDKNGVEVDENGEMIFASGQYFGFENGNDICLYNKELCQWNCFRMNFEKNNLYFWIHDIQENETSLYIQGMVCDATKSAIAGPYVEKDAPENGIWKVDIKTGGRKQIANKIYYGGIYILNDVLYGIDNHCFQSTVKVISQLI